MEVEYRHQLVEVRHRLSLIALLLSPPLRRAHRHPAA
jgi:hypothetical protein